MHLWSHSRRLQVQNIPANAALPESCGHLPSSSLRELYYLVFLLSNLSKMFLFGAFWANKSFFGGGKFSPNFSYSKKMWFWSWWWCCYLWRTRIWQNNELGNSAGDRFGMERWPLKSVNCPSTMGDPKVPT